MKRFISAILFGIFVMAIISCATKKADEKVSDSEKENNTITQKQVEKMEEAVKQYGKEGSRKTL